MRDTIQNIEKRIEQSQAIPKESKAELLRMMKDLDREVQTLSQTNRDEAASVAGFASAATHEATRKEKNPSLLKIALDGLSKSVEQFEQSHPTLVETVHNITATLSNYGL